MNHPKYLAEFANVMTGSTGLAGPFGSFGQGPTIIQNAGQVPGRPVKKPITRKLKK